MPITRVIYNGNVDVTPEVLIMLRDRLQEIIASELSTSEVRLNSDSVELVFEKGHPLNRGKDLKILIDGNDLPERTDNLQERGERIASKVEEMISVLNCSSRTGFVYVTLQAGGLGKFNF
jgi:hypothetical protein